MATANTYAEFTETLGAAYERLSPQQQVIAQFVLQHPDQVALGTAAVAEAAGVQPSALVRFANAVAFPGFSAMQRLFQDRLLEQAGTYRQRISAMQAPAQSGRPQTLLHTLVDAGAADLRQLEHATTDAALRRAARLLCAAPHVHVLAQRRAFPVAAYLAYALAQLELRVQLHDGVGGMLADSLRQIERGDVLLVTSFTSYSPDVVQAADGARERGVQVVAITDHALSPLKPAAAVCLEIGAGTPAPVRSLVAAMCLAQALVVHAGQCLVEPAAQRASGRNGGKRSNGTNGTNGSAGRRGKAAARKR
jgi:DNA-binding MurR/RpiR family transcriptional regulator